MSKEYVKITFKSPNLKYQVKLPLYEAGQAMTLIEDNFSKAAIRPDKRFRFKRGSDDK